MRALRVIRSWWIDIVALAVAAIVFVVPFIFIVLTAAKDRAEAGLLEFSLPTEWLLIPNIMEVLDTRNGIVVRAMTNSVILTVASVALIVILSAMVAFVLQRRRDRTAAAVAAVMLAGLVIPPAIVPTIYVLQALGIFKTLFGLILVEVAFTMPFAVLIFRAFMSAIPRELDEAAIIDGASRDHASTARVTAAADCDRPSSTVGIVSSAWASWNDFLNCRSTS